MKESTNIFKKAGIEKSDGHYAKVKLSSGRVLEKVPILQHYGFFSKPNKDSYALVVTPFQENNSMLLATANTDAPSLNPGETVIYAKNSEIKLSPSKIELNADKVSVKGTSGELLQVLSDLVVTLKGLSVQMPDGKIGTLLRSDVLALEEIKEKINAFIS